MNQTTHRRTWLVLVVVALFALALSACSKEENKNTAAPASTNTAANTNQPAAASSQLHTVILDTTMGKITIELLDKDAPVTADNFRQLAASGFYNGLTFHRTIKGFMIQGGDPKGDGSGGRTANGQRLPNEVNRNSPLYQGGYARGLVAMANQGGNPTTGSSQFFIMHQNYPLPPQYTIFGRVTAGMEVVDKIAAAPTEPGSDRPASPVKMTKVTVQ